MTIAAAIGATSQPRLVSYITVDMFKAHRRSGVQVDNLVRGGRPDEQNAALAEAIESGCAWVDSTTLYPLAATYDTVIDERITPDRYGYLNITPRFQPVLALTDFWCGPRPNQMTQAQDLSVAGIKPNKIAFPVGGAVGLGMSSAGPLQFGGWLNRDDPLWIKYTYINGWPVTSLTAAVTEGDQSIQVADCTGIIPGQTWLTVHALQNRWKFLAGAVSAQAGAGTVACAPAPHSVPLKAGYEATQVTALPPDLIEAVVLATRAVIKDGPNGTAAKASGSTGKSKDETATAGDDFVEAELFLRPYILPVE
jgi:hypothetical protein